MKNNYIINIWDFTTFNTRRSDSDLSFKASGSKLLKRISPPKGITRLLIAFALAFFALSSYANMVKINETFETGLPTTAPAVDATVTLSSGSWVINNVNGKSDNGSIRVAMKTNGYIITPSVDKPSTLTFNHRGSGSGKIITVQKSIGGGAWVVVGTATVSSSSTYATSTFAINETGSVNVRIRFVCSSATIYIDNVKIEVSETSNEPTIQASISASSVTGSSAVINITPGNGQGRLLVRRTSADVAWSPVDGISYTAGSQPDGNHTVAYVGTASSTTITGLEAGTTYYFAVFEYNGTDVSTNYLVTNPGKVQVITLQVPTLSISPTSLNFGNIKPSTVEKRQFTLSAKYLSTASGNIMVSGADVFTVSLSSASGFSASITLPYSSNTLASTLIYVQFAPTQIKAYSNKLTISGGGASNQELIVSGTCSNTTTKVYYISPAGSDANSGAFDAPLKNLQVAVNKLFPGDTIFVHGGIYYPDYKQDSAKTTIRLNASGTADKILSIFNYPGEAPILNFRDQPKKISVRGVQLNGNYWHIRGLHFTEAGDNGMKVEGSHNVIEKCTFSYNDDAGMQLGFGHNFTDSHPGISSNDGSYCSYNDIVECDAYLNYDSDNRGSDADGFACKMHNGKRNRFIRCRSWDNADDAWDLFETDFPVYLVECWGWGSGRESNFTVVGGSFQGNGNGIKLGGNGAGGSSKGKHEAWYCVAFNNNKTNSVKGFDQNSHAGGIKLVNCLSFGNGYDYMFETASGVREFYNNICFGKIEIASGATQGKNASISSPTEGWTNNVCSNFTTADYLSLAESDAKLPRGTNGSMPTTFARLVNSSVLIDKGDIVQNSNSELSDLGLPWTYAGVSPDLGPYENKSKSAPASQIIINRNASLEVSAFPNPIADNGTLKFSVNYKAPVSIGIFTLQGKKISEVFTNVALPGIDYYEPMDVSKLPNGVYVVVLTAGGESSKCKLIVAR